MPVLSKSDAADRLATRVENAKPSDLVEFYEELFPEKSGVLGVTAKDIVVHIRNGLEAEEVVDLWNVVFPRDRNVWYDEVEQTIHYNDELVGSTD